MCPADQFARDGQSCPVCTDSLSGLQVVLVIRGALPVGSLRRLISRPSQHRRALPAELARGPLLVGAMDGYIQSREAPRLLRPRKPTGISKLEEGGALRGTGCNRP